MSSVILTFSSVFPRSVSRFTVSPSPIPSFFAVSVLTSSNGSGMRRRKLGMLRCWEWVNMFALGPLTRINGYSLAKSGVLSGLSGGSLNVGSGS